MWRMGEEGNEFEISGMEACEWCGGVGERVFGRTDWLERWDREDRRNRYYSGDGFYGWERWGGDEKW